MFSIRGLRSLRKLLVPALLVLLGAEITGLAARDKDRPRKERKARSAEGRDAGASQQTKPGIATAPNESARLAATLPDAKHPLTPAIAAARASRELIQKVPGYSCTFIKQERLKKGAIVHHTAQLKFRREPFSVYMKYVDPHAGREVIFVEGRNKGKLLVHEPSGLASVVGTISLSPTSNDALKENRYPITMLGMEKMLDTAIAEWEAGLKSSEIKVQLYPQAKIGDGECTMYEIVCAKANDSLKNHKSRVYFDKKTKLPIRCEQYGFPAKPGEEPPLVEEYTYSDLKLDVSLSDHDFDVKNDSYGFK